MLVLLWLLAGLQFLVTREPVPADPMAYTFQATCGETRVKIDGFGLARLPRDAAAVQVNGMVLSDERTSRLARDLSDDRAVYRLVALCSQDNVLQLQIYVGESSVDGQVNYQTASATFAEGRLYAYSELQPADESSFWFR